MLEMEAIDDEDFLSLSLALVTNSCYPKKRIRQTPNHSSDNSSQSETSDQENKIFSLLQMRERMLTRIHDHHQTSPRLLTNHHHQEESVKGLHLIHLLLISATSLHENNLTSVTDNLVELYQNVSLTGDSVQRVASYFADGLVARLLTRKSPFYDTIMKAPTPDEEFLSFTEIYKASPFYQFAHFTANQAILEAFEKEQNSNNRALHVIDFDLSYGFQWPSLMQSLSENASPTNKILLKITGFGRNQEQLQETESRLVNFSKGFKNLVFEFHGIVKSSSSRITKPRIKKNETVAVNLVFYLNSLNSYYKISEVLRFGYSLNPSIVVLVEQEGSRNTHNFLSRFMESLHYFAAIFDSLDDCLPLDSPERLSIERNHLGREIKCLVNCDENLPRFEKMETWRGRMEGHGFCGVAQSSNSIMQAKLLLKIRSSNCSAALSFDGENVNGGFNVFERDDGMAISLGWQDRFLITASSWCCV